MFTESKAVNEETVKIGQEFMLDSTRFNKSFNKDSYQTSGFSLPCLISANQIQGSFCGRQTYLILKNYVTILSFSLYDCNAIRIDTMVSLLDTKVAESTSLAESD